MHQAVVGPSLELEGAGRGERRQLDDGGHPGALADAVARVSLATTALGPAATQAAPSRVVIVLVTVGQGVAAQVLSRELASILAP